MRTLHELNKVNDKAAKSMERLSSGLRINSAADDAAGMAIANKMDAQIRGLRQANRNTMDGISMVQTAEGALNETHAILQRMRELSVQASNGTYSEDDRGKVQQEIDELTEEINRISQTTEFNTKPLLKGKDDKSGLIDNDIKFEGGTDGTPRTSATATINLPNPMSKEDIAALNGKTISIEPVGEIKFYNPPLKNGGVGVDLTTIKDADELAVAIKKAVDELPAYEIEPGVFEKVTAEVDPLDGSVIKLTAPIGEAGNNLNVSDGALVDEATFTLQVGANEGQTMDISIGEMSADALGLTGKPGTPGFTAGATISDGNENTKTRATLDFSNAESAGNAITAIDNAISMVSEQRSKLGAVQNRLEHTTNNLGVSEENLTASMSRIQDADMAHEMSQYTQQNVISQAAMSMLAQANQRPQQVLQLLQR